MFLLLTRYHYGLDNITMKIISADCQLEVVKFQVRWVKEKCLGDLSSNTKHLCYNFKRAGHLLVQNTLATPFSCLLSRTVFADLSLTTQFVNKRFAMHFWPWVDQTMLLGTVPPTTTRVRWISKTLLPRKKPNKSCGKCNRCEKQTNTSQHNPLIPAIQLLCLALEAEFNDKPRLEMVQ